MGKVWGPGSVTFYNYAGHSWHSGTADNSFFHGLFLYFYLIALSLLLLPPLSLSSSSSSSSSAVFVSTDLLKRVRKKMKKEVFCLDEIKLDSKCHNTEVFSFQLEN